MSQQQVLLTVPAQPEFLRVARVTASGLESRLGFSLDEVDDLRLALDELCFALIGKGEAEGDLSLCYQLAGDHLAITGSAQPQFSNEPPKLGDLSRQILTALVDDHRLWEAEGSIHFSLTKRQVATTR